MTHHPPAACLSHATRSHWMKAGLGSWPRSGSEGKSDSWKASFAILNWVSRHLSVTKYVTRTGVSATTGTRNLLYMLLVPAQRPTSGGSNVGLFFFFSSIFKIVPATWRKQGFQACEDPQSTNTEGGPIEDKTRRPDLGRMLVKWISPVRGIWLVYVDRVALTQKGHSGQPGQNAACRKESRPGPRTEGCASRRGCGQKDTENLARDP